jgi:hypothetical protein
VSKALLGFAMFGVFASLACGGRSAPESEFVFVDDDEMLVQTSTGLWTTEGRFLHAIAGTYGADISILGHPAAPVLLQFEPNKIGYLDPADGGFFVRDLEVSGQVLVLLGPRALVQLTSSDGATSGESVLLSVDGTHDRAGTYVAGLGDEWPPVDQPEYWWTTSWLGTPVPVCSGRPRQCGWLTAGGDWLIPPSERRVPPLLHAGVPAGVDLIAPDGEFLVGPPLDVDVFGPLSEGHLLAGRIVEGIRRETIVVDREGETTGVVAVPVAWIGQCPGPRGTETCQYAFHDGLAPIRLAPIPGFSEPRTAYVNTVGEVAIGPDVCLGPAPSGPFHDGRAFHCRADGYWLIDRAGSDVAGPFPAWNAVLADRNSYPFGLFFSEGLAAVPTEGGWQYVNTSGEVVLSGPFRVARPFRGGVAAVLVDDVIQYIGVDGSPRFVSGQ